MNKREAAILEELKKRAADGDANALYQLGLLDLTNKDFLSAQENFKAALASDRHHDGAALELGCLYAEGRPNKSKPIIAQDFDAATKLLWPLYQRRNSKATRLIMTVLTERYMLLSIRAKEFEREEKERAREAVRAAKQQIRDEKRRQREEKRTVRKPGRPQSAGFFSRLRRRKGRAPP